MTDQTHQSYRELLPAYALGSLDPEEQFSLEAHLKTCAECRAALRDYQAIEEGLLLATTPHSPPPALRGRLRARLEAAGAPRPRRRFGLPSFSFARLAAGAALLLLLALNLSTYLQLRDLQRQQALLAGQLQVSQTALAIASQPGGQTIRVSGQAGSGSFIADRNLNTGVLFASGLSPLDSSQTYQIWLIDANGVPISAGLFRPEPGQAHVAVLVVSSQPLSNFKSLGVTVEPAGGVPEPTGPLALGAEF